MSRLSYRVLLVVLLLALTGCSQNGQEATPPARETATVAEAPPAATSPAATSTTESSPTPEAEAVLLPGLEMVAEGLTAPVTLLSAPDDSGRLFIVDQVGLIRVVTAEGELLETPFLDIQDRLVELTDSYDERGLLGMVFHPDYAENGRFFVYYSTLLHQGAPTDWDHTSQLSEFTVSAEDPNQANPGSERSVLWVDQPQANHNGGTIAFGPDGYLYLSLGDGGAANDVGPGHAQDWYAENEGGNGQEITSYLLGKILRLDVDDAQPFAIPEDNPFAGETVGLDEIYAYGFRNPYRFSFDTGGSNQLFVADAGQDLYEEVSIVEAGGNYGWNVKEGTHCFSTASPDAPPESCPSEDPEGKPLIDPIIEYSHAEGGLAVVGGYVYRGSALPALEGQYIFGNWSQDFSTPSGRLFAAQPPASGEGMWSWEELSVGGGSGDLGHFLLGLGQDESGEIYLMTTDSPGPTGNTGKVYKLVPLAGSDTGQESNSAAVAPTGTVIEVQLVEGKLLMPPMLPAGPLIFEVSNQGEMEHSFEIKGNGLEEAFEQPLQPGETRTMELTLAAGNYEIYCPLGNHADVGMMVALTVTE